MHDVAIIGVGLHPFGRFDKTAMEMGAEAINLALDDCGLQWKDMQFAVGGSFEVSNPDAITRLVGLTGIQFTNVQNACATSASAIKATAEAISSGSRPFASAASKLSSILTPLLRKDSSRRRLAPRARESFTMSATPAGRMRARTASGAEGRGSCPTRANDSRAAGDARYRRASAFSFSSLTQLSGRIGDCSRL